MTMANRIRCCFQRHRLTRWYQRQPMACVAQDDQKLTLCHCSLAYSALASFTMGMSGSASFQRVRKARMDSATAEAPPCASTQQSVGRNVLGRVRSQSSNQADMYP